MSRTSILGLVGCIFAFFLANVAGATVVHTGPGVVSIRLDDGDGHDTYAREGDESEHGNSWTVWFGKADVYYNRGYFKFDEVAQLGLRGDQVRSATLSLFVGQLSHAGVQVTLGGYRVTEDWDERQMKGSTQPSYDPISIFTSTETSSLGWKQYDVTSLLQGWLSDAYPNFGIRLSHDELSAYGIVGSEATGTDPNWPDYKPGNRPYVEIYYTPVPEPHAALIALLGGIQLLGRKRRR